MNRNALVLVVIFCITLHISATAQGPEASMKWAERLLAQGSVLPTNTNMQCIIPRYELAKAINAFEWIMFKYGPSKRALVGKSNALEQRGEYDRAATSLKKALELSPGNKAILSKLSQIKKSANVSKQALSKLPKGQVVLRVLQHPEAKDSWLVLSARNVRPEDEYLTSSEYDDVYLSLFKQTSSGLGLIWQSGKLGIGGYSGGSFSYVQLYLVDLTGDRKLEVVIPEVTIGASWCPSHLDVFGFRGDKPYKMIGVNSHEPVEIRDINSDGKYEIINNYAIGTEMGHAGQPRWGDIYAYKNRHYALANSDFPGEFKHWVKDLRVVLREYPQDPEIHKYLGITYAIFGQKKTAILEYSKAVTLYRKVLKEATYPETRARAEWELHDISQRMRKLEH